MSSVRKKKDKMQLLMQRVMEWREAKLPSWVRENERRRLLKAYTAFSLWQQKISLKRQIPAQAVVEKKKKKEEKFSNRKFWVDPKLTEEERLREGASNNLVIKLRHDREQFIEFFQMDLEAFDELYTMLEHKITKQTVVRNPIPARTRLEICLRFLASQDNTKVIGDLFRVGHNTVSKIIKEVCQSIYETLKNKVFPKTTENIWKQKALEFKEKFGFPHCIGFIDEKCVVVKQPGCNNESTVKPIIFLTISDCNNMFTAFEVEEQDGSSRLFHSGNIGQSLLDNSLKVPAPSFIEDGTTLLPYVLLGSDPFVLSTKIIRPYEEEYCYLTEIEQNFNENFVQIQSNALCTFDIFAARWRVFSKPICASPLSIKMMIMATTCLHNYLMKKDLAKPLEERYYSITKDSDIDFPPTAFVDNLGSASSQLCQAGSHVRDAFATYLNFINETKY